MWAACDPSLSVDQGATPTSPAEPGGPGGQPGNGTPGGPGGGPGGDDAGTSVTGMEPDQPATGPCVTTFRVKASAGATVKVAGEWDAFKGATEAKPDAKGVYTAQVPLTPGLYGYKVIVNDEWKLDDGARLRKYVGGTENSGVRVLDCDAPKMALIEKSQARANAGAGTYHAKVALTKRDRTIVPKDVKATLRRDDTSTEVPAKIDNTSIVVDVANLADGKYTLFVDAADEAGKRSEPVRLVFWVEASAFDWRDALIYMAMVDRFEDGNPSNNPAKTAGVDPRADYYGGDLEGLRRRIADGTFDKLGVRALWLSPFHTNPTGAWAADTPPYKATGYHGYWPTKAREVDPRIGGKAALAALTKEAHAHGIRVLQDFVVNHIHIEHEYYAAHKDWFRTGCICGTDGCGWTEKRLECLFSNYMPDVNWTVTEASEQFTDDAVWWIDSFDLDGLRVDAVKHVEDAAIMNLATKVRETFETGGTRVFMTGETAMGWSDCGLDCNKDQYGTISQYIGPWKLDGQFDFVLYHAVPYRTFAYDQKGMIHADYWSQQSTTQYPAGAIMTPYIGSQDTSRFTTMSTYRGQTPAFDQGIASQKWETSAAAPPDAEPYARHRLALAWMLTQPGAPMLYYGDEYGQWGAGDPNNRVMWRGASSNLSTEELKTLELTRALGTARQALAPLRRGAYVPIATTEDNLMFARREGSNTVVVAMTRKAEGATLSIDVSSFGFAEGAMLKDALGGPSVKVQGGKINATIGGRGAAIYAP